MALDNNTVYKATLVLTSVGNSRSFTIDAFFDPDLTHSGHIEDVPSSVAALASVMEFLLEESFIDVDGRSVPTLEAIADDEEEYNEMPDVSNVIQLHPPRDQQPE